MDEMEIENGQKKGQKTSKSTFYQPNPFSQVGPTEIDPSEIQTARILGDGTKKKEKKKIR